MASLCILWRRVVKRRQHLVCDNQFAEPSVSGDGRTAFRHALLILTPRRCGILGNADLSACRFRQRTASSGPPEAEGA